MGLRPPASGQHTLEGQGVLVTRVGRFERCAAACLQCRLQARQQCGADAGATAGRGHGQLQQARVPALYVIACQRQPCRFAPEGRTHDDDGRDEDCDGKVDDLDPSLDPTSRGTFYGDKDHDGHGVPDDTWLGCHPPEGFAVVADDCDDDDPMIHPGTPDPDDGVDEDCDGAAESYDSDRDGVPDTTERPLGLDPDDSDSDADGRPDGVELGDPAAPTDTDGDGTLDALDEDDDGDTLPTADELGDPAAPNDTDGDGTIDALDLDSDADGTPDAVEAGRDSDHDGVPNAREADDDGDGRLSAAEDATNPDADGDQVPNSLDADSDGDGCPDVAESDDAWLDAADASACPVDSGTPAPDPGRRDDASEGCGCATGASGPGGTAIAALAGLAFLTRRRGARAEAAAALHPMRSRRPPGPLDP